MPEPEDDAEVKAPKPPGPKAWERAERLEPQPAPADPALIGDGAGLPFEPSALTGPPLPLDLADPAVAALLARIRGQRVKPRMRWRKPPPSEPLPATPEVVEALAGWRRLARTDTEALFGLGRPPRMLTVAIRRDPRFGEWLVIAMTRERPFRAVRDTIRASSWRLDPTYDPRPEDTELRLLVTEQRRSGGRWAHGRFLVPDLHLGDAALTLTMFVTPAHTMGVQGANPETPVLIALPEPVGERELIDGAVWEPPGGEPPAEESPGG